MSNKFHSGLLAFLVSVFLVLTSFHAGRRTAKPCVTVTDTLTVIDTLCYYYPVAKDSTVVRYITQVLPVVYRDTITTYRTDTFFAENYAHNLLKIMHNDGENIPPIGLSDERDSISVEIPITHKRYENAEYTAWVSGYSANLDSIRVFPRTTILRESVHKPPNKWHIGISGGISYGFSCRNPEPYIGIGITYSLISF